MPDPTPKRQYQRHGIDTRKVSYSIPATFDRKLRAVAETRGVTMATIITEALRMYFTVTPVVAEAESEAA